MIFAPSSAPVAGPVGLVSDLTIGVLESPEAILPTAIGAGVNVILKTGDVPEKKIIDRISAGASIGSGEVLD